MGRPGSGYRRAGFTSGSPCAMTVTRARQRTSSVSVQEKERVLDQVQRYVFGITCKKMGPRAKRCVCV